MKTELIYKGKLITKILPSGFYQYYSDKQKRFLTFDYLNDCKLSIKNKE